MQYYNWGQNRHPLLSFLKRALEITIFNPLSKANQFLGNTFCLALLKKPSGIAKTLKHEYLFWDF